MNVQLVEVDSKCVPRKQFTRPCSAPTACGSRAFRLHSRVTPSLAVTDLHGGIAPFQLFQRTSDRGEEHYNSIVLHCFADLRWSHGGRRHRLQDLLNDQSVGAALRSAQPSRGSLPSPQWHALGESESARAILRVPRGRDRGIPRRSGIFDPAIFRDRYREALRELAEAKLKGRSLPAKVAHAPPPVVDLMEVLKRSIAQESGAPTTKPQRKAAGDRRQQTLLLPVSGKIGQRPVPRASGSAVRARRRKA